ncbi:hypothetical protein AX769_13360 [Frondihabitans sp. PAMC 28766]|nr:hypothetical protein AX769_13360 [Frondihabitans sp. PAMC 28766]
MVPARDPDARSLADVVPSCIAAVTGPGNEAGFVDTLRLGRASHVVILVVDGLGAANLNARSAYARTLSAAGTSIFSGFPTTTAAALATLTTGALPGQHGLVGYKVLDAANDRVVKQLSGWDALLDPATWQRLPTTFEKAAGSGVAVWAVGPTRYSDSGLTRAILRGARYRSAESVTQRFDAAIDILHDPAPSVTYLYVPELDMAAHRYGWESDQWAAALESLDAEVRRLVASLGREQALLVTADHGIIDVPEHKHVIFGDKLGLLDGVRHLAGEPRCLQLHFDASADNAQRVAVVDAWRAAEGQRAWVVTRDEAIEAGWFGEVAPEVTPRIGDVLIAARKGIAYYATVDERSRGMIGQHGSWSPDETQVPLLRFGAFAR